MLSLAFSPDGKLLATGSYRGRLDLWDVAARSRHGKPMTVKDDGFPSVAFDPSGRLVAGGGAIGPVRVWRVADQRPAFPPLSGHTSTVTGTAFDPSGAFLATTSLLGGTRLWDPDTGLGYGDELVASARPGFVRALHRSSRPLGCGTRSVPTASNSPSPELRHRAMLWDVDPASWRRRACAIVGRNLSRAEWKLYMPVGHSLSADLPGVGHRLSRSPFPNGQKMFP